MTEYMTVVACGISGKLKFYRITFNACCIFIPMALLLKDLITEVSLLEPQKTGGNDLNRVRSIIEKRCPIALKKYQEGVRIYRGVDSDKAWLYVNAGRTERVSAATQNYYTLITDNNPAWKKFPKRSKSTIATGELGTAESYGWGEPYVVFPMGDPLVGVCPSPDFWFSFENSLKWFNYDKLSSMDVFNSIIFYLGELFNVQIDDSDFQSFSHSLHEIGLIIRNTPPHELYPLMSDADIEPGASPATDRIIKYLLRSDKDLPQMLMELFTPKRNGFKLKKLSQLTPSDIDDNEVWFSAPSILIRHDRV